MSQTYPNNVPNLPKTCPTLIQIMSQTYPNHVPNLPKTCPTLIRIMSQTYPNHVPNLSKIYPKLVQKRSDANLKKSMTVSMFCLNTVWTVSQRRLHTFFWAAATADPVSSVAHGGSIRPPMGDSHDGNGRRPWGSRGPPMGDKQKHMAFFSVTAVVGQHWAKFWGKFGPTVG